MRNDLIQLFFWWFLFGWFWVLFCWGFWCVFVCLFGFFGFVFFFLHNIQLEPEQSKSSEKNTEVVPYQWHVMDQESSQMWVQACRKPGGEHCQLGGGEPPGKVPLVLAGHPHCTLKGWCAFASEFCLLCLDPKMFGVEVMSPGSSSEHP